MDEPAPRRARDIARAALIADITDTARRHVADEGASGLSLRAVARELGMASSAIYRYFPSRDALLTQLIIDAYNALGDAVDGAESLVPRDAHLDRFRAVAHAIRGWARANPHEYALIYGSPVPGYAAPDDTIDPATRVAVVLMQLLADVDAAGGPTPDRRDTTPMLAEQVEALVATTGLTIDSTRLLHGVGAWVELFGLVNFELFGQFANTFDDAGDLFAWQVDRMAERVGITI